MSICICDAYAPDKRPGLCPIHAEHPSLVPPTYTEEGAAQVAALLAGSDLRDRKPEPAPTGQPSGREHSMTSRTVIISHAIVMHDVPDDEPEQHTGALVQEILHTVIRDRTSLDSIQATVHEVRASTEFEVHTTNTNDIDDPPHLPAYTNEDGTILVTLVNNEQGALLARREHTSERWPPGLHLTITRD